MTGPGRRLSRSPGGRCSVRAKRGMSDTSATQTASGFVASRPLISYISLMASAELRARKKKTFCKKIAVFIVYPYVDQGNRREQITASRRSQRQNAGICILPCVASKSIKSVGGNCNDFPQFYGLNSTRDIGLRCRQHDDALPDPLIVRKTST